MTVPNRMPPTPAGRAKNVATTHAALSGQGQTKAARPVTQGGRQARIYTPPPTGTVTVGDTTGHPDATAISSTTGAGSGSTALADRATAVGNGSSATGDSAVAVGDGSNANSQGGTALGPGSTADGNNAVSVGPSSTAAGAGAVAMGFFAEGHGSNTLALGPQATCGTSGSPVTDAVAIGLGAAAVADHDFILGTTAHNVQVPGHLIIADGTTLYRLDATGGTLTLVAYP